MLQRFSPRRRLLFSTLRSGNAVVERHSYAGLDRLSNLGGHLLGEFAELFALRDHRLELLARMCDRQCDELQLGFHPHKFFGVFKGSLGIGTGDLNDLEVVICGALGGRRIGILEEVGCFRRISASRWMILFDDRLLSILGSWRSLRPLPAVHYADWETVGIGLRRGREGKRQEKEYWLHFSRMMMGRVNSRLLRSVSHPIFFPVGPH
jgi:hypothetical protein